MLEQRFTVIMASMGNVDINFTPALAVLGVQLMPFLQGEPGSVTGITDEILDAAVEELRFDYDGLLAATLTI